MTTGVVMDDLVENNGDVRPLVCYDTGEKTRAERKGSPDHSWDINVPNVIRYTLDAICAFSRELYVNRNR